MTDVIEEIGNLDFEVGIARHVKTLAHLVVGPMLLVSKLHTATALGNIHALRRLGRKTVAAGQHHAQRVHLDETFSVLLVVRAPVVLEGRNGRVEQRITLRLASNDNNVALVKLQTHDTVHGLPRGEPWSGAS